MSVPRVLIVDDETQVLSTLSAFLIRAGFHVTAQNKFEEAKRILTAAPPDILVTDVRLGRFNGLQLALVMREVRPSSRIVVLSAYDDPALRQEAERIGARYFVKPLSGRQLVAALKEAVASPPSAADVRTA